MNTHSRILTGGLLTGLLTLTVALAVRATQSIPTVHEKSDSVKTSATDSRRVPVVVELFTSEGCSSCPSADKVVADLKRDQPVKDARILVVGVHVDYWNSIGWRDPFSSAGATARQYGYGRKFRLDSVYTPQAVIDGQAQMVGSERDNVLAAIEKSTQTPKAQVDIVPEPGAADKVRVTVRRLPGADADVMLAITEDNLSSNVSRGENAGRKLAHVGVTRVLRKIGSVSGREPFTTTTALELQSGWKRSDLEAVVFVQERASLHIVGANAVRLLEQK